MKLIAVNGQFSMKEQPRTSVTNFRNSNFLHGSKNEMKRLQISQKLVYEKLYIHEKNLRKRNCCRKFVRNVLPEKPKENM